MSAIAQREVERAIAARVVASSRAPIRITQLRPFERAFREADELLSFYLGFFETFCANADGATDDSIGQFRKAMLGAADLLQLSSADRLILRRHNARELCRWMRSKQNETTGALANDRDSLSLTTCSEIPLLFLVVFDHSCFDILSLAQYLRERNGRDAQKNPTTQVPFTDDQLRYIEDRYDATVRILRTVRNMAPIEVIVIDD